MESIPALQAEPGTACSSNQSECESASPFRAEPDDPGRETSDSPPPIGKEDRHGTQRKPAAPGA